MIAGDLTDFGRVDVGHRMLHGGLPPFFLAPRLDEKDFEEWMSSYCAKDLSDFVLEVGRRREPVAIECRSAAAKFDPAGLKAFRAKHPRGKNVVVTLRSTEKFEMRFDDMVVEFIPYLDLSAWPNALKA